MISFALACEAGHEFDAWFRSSDDFDSQAGRGLVQCPHCGSSKVSKALMAPAVATAGRKDRVALAAGVDQRRMIAQLKELASKVRENADYVGDKFAEEARKIHFGETEARGIYGEASPDEVKSLVEDGVEIAPLPIFPDDQN